MLENMELEALVTCVRAGGASQKKASAESNPKF